MLSASDIRDIYLLFLVGTNSSKGIIIETKASENKKANSSPLIVTLQEKNI